MLKQLLKVRRFRKHYDEIKAHPEDVLGEFAFGFLQPFFILARLGLWFLLVVMIVLAFIFDWWHWAYIIVTILGAAVTIAHILVWYIHYSIRRFSKRIVDNVADLEHRIKRREMGMTDPVINADIYGKE